MYHYKLISANGVIRKQSRTLENKIMKSCKRVILMVARSVVRIIESLLFNQSKGFVYSKHGLLTPTFGISS